MTRLDDIFEVAYGNKLDMNKMTASTPERGVAFVGRIGGLNGRSGVSGFVEPIPDITPYPAGLLTVALGGSLLSTYVQQRPFYTAQNVAVLTPLSEMTTVERLYYAMCIHANAFRYSTFGREANRSLGTIELPDSVPSWVVEMEIPSKEGIVERIAPQRALSEPDTWGEFRVEELFTVASGKYIPTRNKSAGTTPEITSSAQNNGRRRMIDQEPNFPGGTISVARNGSVGTAFFQPTPFFATDDVRVWTAKKGPMNLWEGLFLCRIISLEAFRYTYGRKWSLSQMRETVLRLPVTSDGEPDWVYMSEFMQGLRFSAAIARVKADV